MFKTQNYLIATKTSLMKSIFESFSFHTRTRVQKLQNLMCDTKTLPYLNVIILFEVFPFQEFFHKNESFEC